MAKLRARARRRLKKSSFVYPRSRSYPIHDKAHARAALRMAGRKDTKGSLATVKRKVYKKYPSLKPKRRSR